MSPNSVCRGGAGGNSGTRLRPERLGTGGPVEWPRMSPNSVCGEAGRVMQEPEVRRYRTTLPVEIDGVVYQFGQVVELATERALEYAHALIALEEGE